MIYSCEVGVGQMEEPKIPQVFDSQKLLKDVL